MIFLTQKQIIKYHIKYENNSTEGTFYLTPPHLICVPVAESSMWLILVEAVVTDPLPSPWAMTYYDLLYTHPVNPSSNTYGLRHPDVLSGRSAPPTGICRMKPPPPAAYGADGSVEGAP
jgi:hypothetical protein